MEFGFLIKKFITFFVEPYGMVLSLFIIGLFLLFAKKVKLAKTFLSLACGIHFLFAYPPFSNALVKGLVEKYPKYNYTPRVKYIHALENGNNTHKQQPSSVKITQYSE